MQAISVYLDIDRFGWLDSEAKRKNCPRSHVVASAIDLLRAASWIGIILAEYKPQIAEMNETKRATEEMI